MPDLVVAVAPFTQPTQTTELLSGFIPEDQKKISEETLAKLDALFHEKLKNGKRSYVFLSDSDISGDMARDARGRRNALVTWATRARAAGADMIVVPHIIRLLVGPDNKRLLPLSAFGGACLVIFSDIVSRTVSPTDPVPIGVITALIGAPFFVALLRRKGGEND